MSEPAQKPDSLPEQEPEDELEDKGPNLVLLYSLLALALIVAITFAALVVWPFYSRR